MSTAVESAKERDLQPLVEESVVSLGFDRERRSTLEAHLDEAWFFGVRLGHAVMLGARTRQTGLRPVILEMESEFQELMERLADALDTTVGRTIQAWELLGRAWIAGSKFWEVEIAARLIESGSEGFDEGLNRLKE